MRLNSLKQRKPSTIARAKNRMVEAATFSGLDVGSLKPMTTVSTMIPMTSSMMAAFKMVVPTSVFSLPSSFKACTVMLTDVAVRITPIKTAW